MPKLHVITLNWNGKHLLQNLLPSLNSALTNTNNKLKTTATLWVRDNGSTDDSVDYLEDYAKNSGLNINVLKVGHNRDSFAAGVNSLVKESKAHIDDFFLLLNNDVNISDSSSLTYMLSLFHNFNIGMVGCRLLFPDSQKLQHAGVTFSPGHGGMPYHYRPGATSDDQAKRNRYFQAVTAACCFVRASTWQGVGGLDEGYRWAFEDIDLCLKVGQSKEKVAYCGKTLIYHGESVSLKKNPVNKIFLNDNVKLFKSKWQGKISFDNELYLKDQNYNVIKDA